MGLLSFTAAGGGFILIGFLESMSASNHVSDSSSTFAQINGDAAATETTPLPSSVSLSKGRRNRSFSSFSLVSVLILSFFFMLNSLVSAFNAVNSSDRVGSVLQLQVLAVASLFFLYSVLGLSINFRNSFSLPGVILDLIILFGFVEEFLLFYLQRKDKSGIENRYFDLMLVPILVCVVSTIFGLETSKSRLNYARLARGIGMILQGLWFLQMGFSFYTRLIANGCSLHEKSRGNYTIRCKGHQEYHRARAIVTLQFNGHLALLVIVVVGLYSIMAQRNGIRGDFSRYRPLGAEMQQMEIVSNFTLDSEEEEIKEEDKMSKPKVEAGVNGYGSHE
ncbi:Transmembrane protein like [Melia azedarach]|uniref:Transmembrane protein like n=1 Tax=Melia azedarach TaxID=155640 RepID=A0ACC1X8V7_MELAZ|nr:Transmembrane protein like [Melia azedarach]